MGKRIFVVYSLCILFTLLAFVYGFNWLSTSKMISDVPADMLSGKGYPYNIYKKEFVYAVGRTSQPGRRPSHFLNFPKKKPEKVIRIGAFGDSITWGSEVVGGLDFPDQLGILLREAGLEDIEVLNFGTGGFGFQSAYLSWLHHWREYDLDYVVLGPGCFQPERDLTFQTFEPFALKGRFILSEKNVKFISALGDTPAERIWAYQSIFPAWSYLRYDIRLPAAFSRLLGMKQDEFPQPDMQRNPFYYSDMDYRAEAREINIKLLEQMRKAFPGKVLFTTIVGSTRDDFRGAPDGIAPVFVEPPAKNFAAARPFGHYSGFGNLQIAKIYAALLMGNTSTKLDEIVADSKGKPLWLSGEKTSLSDWSGLELLGGRVPLALLENEDEPLDSLFGNNSALAGAPALLLIPVKNGSFISDHWVILPSEPADGEELSVAGRKLGHILRVSDDLPIFRLESESVSYFRDYKNGVAMLAVESSVALASAPMIFGQKILAEPTGRGNEFLLRPGGEPARVFSFAGLRDALPDLGSLSDRSDLRLRFLKKNSAAVTVAVEGWEVRRLQREVRLPHPSGFEPITSKPQAWAHR